MRLPARPTGPVSSLIPRQRSESSLTPAQKSIPVMYFNWKGRETINTAINDAIGLCICELDTLLRERGIKHVGFACSFPNCFESSSKLSTPEPAPSACEPIDP